jgi:phage terminase large subunit
MAIILAQRISPSAIGIIDYIEDDHHPLDWYVAELREKRYHFGHDYLPHDGRAVDYRSGMSAETLLKKLGRSPRITPNIGVEPGIRAARMLFPALYIDARKCDRLVECLRHYRRTVNSTGETTAPVHDAFSHGADALRYLAVVADQLRNEDESVRPPVRTVELRTPGGY